MSDNETIDSNTLCWKLEEKRYNLLAESFSDVNLKLINLKMIISIRYVINLLQEHCHNAVNIGWKSSVYSQTCDHYIHFDCYNSYKETFLVINIRDFLLLRIKNLLL